MDARHAHYLHRKSRHFSPLYFLVLAVIFGAISVYALRQNNFRMIELRQAVVVADQQNGDVEKALQDLRKHVHGHMNTNLASGDFAIKPPIQLKARYERLMATEQERVKQLNQQVAAAAEANCAQQFPAGGFNAPRVACIQDYIAVHGAKTNTVADDFYKFDFVSPRWSPDLAGWSMLLSAIFFGLFALRLLAGRWLKIYAH